MTISSKYSFRSLVEWFNFKSIYLISTRVWGWSLEEICSLSLMHGTNLQPYTFSVPAQIRVLKELRD
ncbi:hypothetical protein CICLE_v10023225mg [Citrus x clementina]|uniref:Uncharacterized protein n=1 Tax=Citrus clementina TaxID=85681 RepID=V4TS75_CITCL|nr:hypothetical protein CICLE_v10023225mg [Citrus x clementina]